METLATILVSDNAKIVLFFATIIIVICGFMAKRGVFSVNKGGVRIGKTEGEVRALLMKMNDYAEEFCEAECTYLCSKMANLGFPMNGQNAMFVFLRVLNEVVSWMLVNHISSEKAYVQGRIRDIKNVVGRGIGEVNPILRQDETYMSAIYEYCEDFTTRLLRDLESIRDEERK